MVGGSCLKRAQSDHIAFPLLHPSRFQVFTKLVKGLVNEACSSTTSVFIPGSSLGTASIEHEIVLEGLYSQMIVSSRRWCCSIIYRQYQHGVACIHVSL